MSAPSSDHDDNRPRHIRQGQEFEEIAARFYTGKGFVILERNWRAGHKEIDLIVHKDSLVAFVEVKSTYTRSFGHPVERVDTRKIHNLVAAARQYLADHAFHDVDFRFDVVTFINGQLEHFPDAFTADDY